MTELRDAQNTPGTCVCAEQFVGIMGIKIPFDLNINL
jgi:hypothetical protein